MAEGIGNYKVNVFNCGGGGSTELAAQHSNLDDAKAAGKDHVCSHEEYCEFNVFLKNVPAPNSVQYESGVVQCDEIIEP